MSTLLLLALLAQTPEPFARARLEPSATVTVGQPISIVVDVLVPSYFMGAPEFPDLDVRDALVVFEPRGTNLTERIGGATFAGQSRRYNVYPQREGVYEVTGIGVAVRYFDGGATDAVVSPPPVRFTATIPPGAEGLDPFIATTGLTLEESFDRRPDELRVGDAFTRTLTITVTDALAMVIPPVESVTAATSEPIDGLAVYPKPPTVSDAGGERGSTLVGTRIETATYVAEAPGHYRLPEITIEWWDVGNARRMTASAPALELDVVADVSPEAAIALPDANEADDDAGEASSSRRVSLLSRLKRHGPTVGAIALLMALVALSWRRFSPWLDRRHEEAEHSESAYFARFRDAALSGDPRATARALMAWLDRRAAGHRIALFGEFARQSGDPALTREARKLDAVLYGPDPEGAGERWSGGPLYREVATARTRRSEAEGREDELPPLNP